MILLSIITIFIVSITISYFKNIKDPDPILGIYHQPGKFYYVKYVIFFIMLSFRRWVQKIQHFKAFDKAGRKAEIESKEQALDKIQSLSDHLKAFDAVFFIGANKDGFYVVAGSERRQMGVINGLFYIIIPGKGMLCSPKIPDTLLFGAKQNEFGTEGILFTPIEPMKKWNISYKGKMWYQNDPSKIVDVEFSGEWTNIWKYFDYDTDLDIHAIVRSIAREKWGRKYFETLKNAHQSHYEQFGKMNVNVIIDHKKYNFTLDSFRDHSFGYKRDWTLMHRYAFHHIFCENGLSAAVGVICQPCTASVFEAGVLCLPGGKNKVYPVEWCDLKLYQHGENGIAPVDYAFRFQAGGKIYTVEVKVQYQSEHFVSSDWDARMVERFVKYTVNGISGWGVSEFHYNNKSGRPIEYSSKDPDWHSL